MSNLIVEVSKIEKVEKHLNADKLDIVTVKGWRCIVGREQYKQDDLVIFVPPDSIIPTNIIEKYKLEFLKKNGRVGTIKLRGQISQGLILDVPENCHIAGKDVADILGITKYEPPEPEFSIGKPKEKISDYWIKYRNKEISFLRFIRKAIGLIKENYATLKKKKLNPYFDKYTDIENINNYNNVIKEGEEVIITEKIHGCNARYGNLKIGNHRLWDKIKCKLFGDSEFVYGSHTVQKRWTNIHKGYYKKDYWGDIAIRYKFNEWLLKDYIIYGEIYGKGIQGVAGKDFNYGLTNDIELVVFDIKYQGRYLSWDDLEKFYKYFLEPKGIKLVPILFKGQYNDDTRKLLTKGNSTVKGAENQIREGCVIKPIQEREEHMGRVILKSINEEYLLLRSNTDFH